MSACLVVQMILAVISYYHLHHHYFFIALYVSTLANCLSLPMNHLKMVFRGFHAQDSFLGHVSIQPAKSQNIYSLIEHDVINAKSVFCGHIAQKLSLELSLCSQNVPSTLWVVLCFIFPVRSVEESHHH